MYPVNDVRDSVDYNFLVLYKELRYRHIYAKHKVIIIIRLTASIIYIFCSRHQPTLEQRFESYTSYLSLFELVLSKPRPHLREVPVIATPPLS